MAPQNKREAEDNGEVCKRIKDDLKEAKAVEANEAGLKDQSGKRSDDDKQQIESNNNVSKAESQVNGSVKEEKKQSGGDSAESKQDSGAHLNGEAKKAGPNNSPKESPAEVEKKVDKEEETNKTNGSEKVEPTPVKVTETAAESSTKAASEKKDEPLEEATSGVMLICGGANWDMTGRKELPKAAKKPAEVDPGARSLWGPHKAYLNGQSLRVKGVFSGCNACHSVIVTDKGETMTFGRNDKGQLGIGSSDTKVTPVVVDGLKDVEVVAAACGRSHTLFLTSDGVVYACGDNKMGQCGTNQQSVQQILTPARIAFKENKKIVKVACGAEFSMIVDEDSRLYSFGHPEHGQLGHNSEGKYFTSGNKYAFHCEYAPRRIVTFIEKSRDGHVSPVEDVRIVDVACGTNHTLAVDTKHRCFSWGFAGYHRLGHSETKNELVPRSIRLFDVPPSTGRGCAKVFAGATHSMALDVNGLLYFWGQNKSSGEATMYPKNVQDLCGWRISSVSCANRSIFVVAEDTCISWGPSPTYGELGYGEGKSKSSTTPNEVKTLEGAHIIKIACGFGHTLLIARDRAPEEKALIEKNFKNWP